MKQIITAADVLNNVENKVNDALKVNEGSMVAGGKFDDVTAAGKPAIRRVYDFVNSIGKRTQLTTFDAQVIEITETIGRALVQREKTSFIICRELYKMKASGKLEKLGFKNVGEYGRALFDMSPNTANQYARIGEHFIDDDYKPRGALPALSVSQYLEFLTYMEKKGLTLDRIESMYLDGVLTDGMSSKTMRKALADEYSKGEAVETTFVEDKDEANEGDKANEANEANEGDKANEANEGDKTNEANEATTFDKGLEVSKALDAIQTIFRVSEALKNHGIEVSFNEALDSVMEGLKALL